MTIIFVTEIVPFPVHGGEKIRSYGLLKILSGNFNKVIAIIGRTQNEAYKTIPFENIEFHEFDFASLYSENKYVNCLQIFKRNKNLIALLDYIFKNNIVDIAFIDYLFYGQYIQYFKSKRIPVIYGTHNVQSQISFQRPAKTLRNLLSISVESLAYYIHEKYYFRKADAIVAVSENDGLYYKKFISDYKVFVIPNFLIEEDYRLNHVEKGEYVIMTAQFVAFQNIVGLEWFLNHIWIDDRFKTKQLFVVGIGSDTVFEKIHVSHVLNNITVLGKVDDLKPYIAGAKVSVVPLLHGSGTRLKCIEAMALKTQLLSTSRGAEGIEHEGAIEIADTPESFIRKLDEILQGKIDSTERAHALYLEKYSSQSSIKILKLIVQQICG